MHILCDDREPFISLDTFLNQNECVILSVESHEKDARILLKIDERNNFKAYCSHLYKETDAFPVPRYMSHYNDTPPHTYFLLARDNDTYTAFFCLSHQGILSSLSGSPNGLFLDLRARKEITSQSETARKLPRIDDRKSVHISNIDRLTIVDPRGFGTVSDEEVISLQALKNLSSPDVKQMRNVLVCVRGVHLEQIFNDLMKKSLEITGGMGKLIEDKLPAPHWLDRLGWESGICLGKEVTHNAIMEAVRSLLDIGYPPSFVLIDEGWQQVQENPEDIKKRLAMYSFEANPKQFPKGIKGIVDDLHQIGVKNVGVWHGIMGYRGGIHPKLAKRYDLPSDSDGRYFLGYDLGQTFKFFYDYYNYLREQGITFIKVGHQDSIHSYNAPGIDTTLLSKNLQAAIQASESIHFACPHFNTDCLQNENLFYWGNSRIAKTSDDIDIDNPIGSMRTIRNHLTNSLWLQHLMQPDFDAWVTNTAQSETLAIFHALSGTINVIGDIAGQHHTNLIKKTVLPGGEILKADKTLTLCEDSIFINPLEEKKAYKAYTLKGSCGIVAAFNLTMGKRTLHGAVSPKDVPELKGEVFAVLSYHNGFVGVIKKQESLTFTLKPNQSDIFTFAPVKKGVAVLGCYPFFLAPGPILEINLEDDSVHISSVVAAPMIIYCERQILEVKCNDVIIPWEYDEKRRALSIDVRSHIVAVHSSYSIVFSS